MSKSFRQRQIAAEGLRAGGTRPKAALAAHIGLSTLKRWLKYGAVQAVVAGSLAIRPGPPPRRGGELDAQASEPEFTPADALELALRVVQREYVRRDELKGAVEMLLMLILRGEQAPALAEDAFVALFGKEVIAQAEAATEAAAGEGRARQLRELKQAAQTRDLDSDAPAGNDGSPPTES